MSKQQIEQLIQTALQELNQTGGLNVEVPRIQIDATKDKTHGDFATNIALVLAKPAQRKPRDLAELIVRALPTNKLLHKVEIAGPGFINFFLVADAFYSVIPDIITKGRQFGHTNIGQNKKV